MKCREARKKMFELLIPGARKAADQELQEHLDSCPYCSALLEGDRQLIKNLTPENEVQVSTGFEERVMNKLETIEKENPGIRQSRTSGSKWRFPAVAAAAALVLIAAGYMYFFNSSGNRGSLIISQALAAERSLLETEGIVHVFRQITYYPVKDTLMSRVRWSFLTNLDATGEMHFHQLSLPDDPDLKITFSEDSWYDPSTSRFAIISRLGQDTISVNSYDGNRVCSIVPGEEDKPVIVREDADAAFSWPEELHQHFGAGGDVEDIPCRFR